MSESEPQAIIHEMAVAAEQGKDLHALARDVTLRALSQRSLSSSEIMTVVHAVTEGVAQGLSRRGGEIQQAVRDVLRGLDEALQKSAEATKLAAEQLVSQGKAFGTEELRPALEDLKHLEEQFLSTVTRVAEAAGGRIKDEFKSQLSHVRNLGTDSGRMVADTLRTFGHQAGAAAVEGAQQALGARHEIRQRLTLLASGILAGMADKLRDKAGAGKK